MEKPYELNLEELRKMNDTDFLKELNRFSFVFLRGREKVVRNDEDYRLRRWAASSPFISEDDIDYFIENERHNDVLGALAKNPRLKKEHVHSLYAINDDWINLNILGREDVPRHIILDLLINTTDSGVKLQALRRVTEKELLFLLLMNLSPKSPVITLPEKLAGDAYDLARAVKTQTEWQAGRN